jgi:transcriptional regulator with XRE-family HTH domain
VARKKVHEWIAQYAEEEGLTYAQIARKTGWNELRVSRLLNGKTRVTAEDVKVFARLLRRSVTELYGEAA